MNKNTKTIFAVIAIIILLVVVFLLLGNKKYEVKFDTVGGSIVETQKVKKNEKAEVPAKPTKEGSVFVNWYLDDEVYDFETPVTKNITLTAKWANSGSEESYYTVTFNTAGGNKIDTVKFKAGESTTIDEPKAPKREGYKFVAWQVDGKDFDFSKKIDKSITLTAKWEKVEDEDDKKEDRPVVNTNNNNNNKHDNNSNNNNNNNSNNNNKQPAAPAKKTYTYSVQEIPNADKFVKIVVKCNGVVIPNVDVTYGAGGNEIGPAGQVRAESANTVKQALINNEWVNLTREK